MASSAPNPLLLCWHASDVSVSGRPKLLPDEIEIRSFDKAGLCAQKDKKVTDELLGPGTCTLTNCRLLFSVNNTSVMHILLSNIVSVEDCKSFFSPSKRAAIIFNTTDHHVIPSISSSNNIKSSDNNSDSSSDNNSKSVGITVEFGIRLESDADKLAFMAAVNDQMKKKAWTHIFSKLKVGSSIISGGSYSNSNSNNNISSSGSADASKTGGGAPDPTPSIGKGGISAIVKKQEQEIKEVKTLSQQAMGDLASLMANAQEVVSIIERYSQYLESRAKEREETGLDPESSSMNGEAFKMEEIMQSIGIISPVTRLSAGRLYHQQLSRQIADLLIEKYVLHKFGGVVTLSDLYCLVNRARGTELLSPSDFVAACELINSLNLDVKFKTFPSGAKVIISNELFSDESIRVRLLNLIKDRFDSLKQGVYAADIAQDLNLSIVIAVEVLDEIEKKGLICRDDNINGLSFYINRF